ncbi:MAG: Ig-like domain-containing protein [Bacteroidales bacterium]|nr:Ig-like domain-containing protein [Bacteroidales bacterium]
MNIGTTYSLPYTLNGPTGGEIIYDKVVYSSDAPTIASVDQNGLITVNGQGSAHIILTGYKLDGTALSDVSVEIVGVRQEYVDGKKCIYALSEIPNNSNGSFILMIDITVPETGNTSITGFTGSFDGNFKTISGLTQPLFGTITNANVYNVIVDKVNISVNGDAGAIAAQATENSRIYNCGVLSTGSKFEFDKPVSGNTSKVTSSASGMSVGGIVGAIFNNTRVANCFSYADVSATGGNYPHASGIVGWADNWVDNDNYVTNGTNCFVVNCMFYGNLTGGQRSPIVFVNGYNGNYTTWNYFRYKSIPNVTGLNQNGALAAQEDMWLKRFKFYQSAVTNHRDLAAVYIFNDASRIDDIAQWYIDETIAPWPILRKAGPQKSILERTIPNTGKANEGNLITNGKKLVDEAGNILDNDVTQRYNMNVGTKGKLHVNFNISGTGVASGGQTYSVDLPITDMDFEHYDYTWGKVVLPFANEFDGWTPNYEYICTGWEISSVTGGTQGTLTDYNFADRNCTAKDIYHATNNPIIFAQGGNWIVPYGVTSINVKAHFAKAYYLADANYDCQGKGSNGIGGTRPTTYHGRTVYTSVANAWNAMGDRTLPHDQALVLVGNYHYNSNQSGNYTGKGCTIMSIDEDNDQQPDFGWYNSNGNYRANWMPMRWDFIALYGFNMVQTNTAPPGIAIPKTVGWLEFTETTICRTYEFESNDGVRSGNDDSHSRNAWIINGGYYQQMVRCFESGNANKLSYMKVGGNAYIKEFFHGNHSKTTLKFTLRPIIVTGGEIAQCFLTGMGNKNEITATNNNVRFYCAGGKIDKYLSVYNGYPVVDATMKVDHARIGRFFGGGTSPKAQLSGDINITMDYSHVDFFCGGPEFGDMGNGKTVTVSTTGSIFGEYYGAGFGGTALTRITNGDGQKTPFSVSGRGRLNYNAGEGGFEVSYEMEALLNGSGGSLWRYYDYRADLSMASTGNVKTTAKDCLFLSYFYGGGCQGKVNGTINSTLNNCVVIVSAFGGGYKAAATTIDVYPTGGNTWQVWDETYKAYSDPIYPTPEEFVWKHGNSNTSNDNTNILYTTADMTQMGRVTGEIKITVNGGTVGENVFGGGNESPSDNKTNVTITGDALIEGDVYGGGNAAPVAQSTNVIIVGTDAESPVEINGSVFGGGLGEPATVGNNTKVHLQDKVNVTNNVYGGGNGAEVKGNTEVIIGE